MLLGNGAGALRGRNAANFRISLPAVHQMILTLEAHGLIEQSPGRARSIRLLILLDELAQADQREREELLSKDLVAAGPQNGD